MIILAGPNGAGKSTVAPSLLQGTLGVDEFVNADVIARALSPDDAESVAIAAGRVMLTRLHELARNRVSFAFETTLASRSFAPWLEELRRDGHSVHIVFLWLPSAEFAVERVARRVDRGGHSVPTDIVRRRYRSGVRNFFHLYEPLASNWRVYDGSTDAPKLIAERVDSQPMTVYDERVWALITRRGTQHEG